MMPTIKAIHKKIDEYNMEEGTYIDRFAFSFFLTCCQVLDMVFPDDLRESNPSAFKFLQMAQAWKSKGSLFAPVPQPTVPQSDHESASSDAEMEDEDGERREDNDNENV